MQFSIYEFTPSTRSVGLGFVLLLGIGAELRANPGATSTNDLPGEIRRIVDQKDREFGSARFCKPARSDGGTEHKLAPLIVEELVHPATDWPAMVDVQTVLEEKREPSRPRVYFDKKAVSVAGQRMNLITYVWFYIDQAGCMIDGGPDAVLMRGVRILIGEDEMPVLWQTLGDPPDLNVFLVASSMESQAKKSNGSPLPGRRFSIEESKERSPDIFVIGELDDGPMPMGPYVYIVADLERKISNVHCRCSPSQFAKVAETVEYELFPAASLDAARMRDVFGINLEKRLGPLPFDAIFRWPKAAP